MATPTCVTSNTVEIDVLGDTVVVALRDGWALVSDGLIVGLVTVVVAVRDGWALASDGPIVGLADGRLEGADEVCTVGYREIFFLSFFVGKGVMMTVGASVPAVATWDGKRLVEFEGLNVGLP